ncbi:hypothetical protein KAT80_03850 [Candidatus Pacearchaeota archaeon]|nr:hypothetical protein [Candidatus Pacearchaeota archaeon]
MNTKNLMVPFVAIVTALFLVATISAYTYNVTGDLADIYDVKIDGLSADNLDDISVIAGETITVKVYFTSAEDASDVRIKAEIEGDKVDVDDRTESFDVEEDKRYRKTLTLKVPYELKDELSENITLNIKVWNGDFKSEIEDITLRVQRPTYNADLKSVSVAQTVEAGESLPVDIVLKNLGYNELDDLYVTVSMSALGIEKTSYFGDLVSIEVEDDDEDSASGRLYLNIPYDAEEGVYTLEVEVSNDDTVNSVIKQIVVKNDFADNVIVSTYENSVAVGEDASYDLIVVNPTNKLKVYRIVTESSNGLSSTTEQAVVAVPAGSSKTVVIIANADSEGEYNFDVNVFSGEELVSKVTLNLKAEGSKVTNPIVVLTVILAIIFAVLLIVLIVLVTRKPEKSEEFGESYY